MLLEPCCVLQQASDSVFRALTGLQTDASLLACPGARGRPSASAAPPARRAQAQLPTCVLGASKLPPLYSNVSILYDTPHWVSRSDGGILAAVCASDRTRRCSYSVRSMYGARGGIGRRPCCMGGADTSEIVRRAGRCSVGAVPRARRHRSPWS